MARSPEEITFINQTDQEVDNLTNINPGEIHIINWKEQKPPIQQGEEIQTVTIGDYMMLTPMLIHLEGDILMVNKNEIIHTTTIEYKLQKAKSFTLKKGYCKLCKLHRYEKTDCRGGRLPKGQSLTAGGGSVRTPYACKTMRAATGDMP